MLFATRRAQGARIAVILMCLAALLFWGCSGGSSSRANAPTPLSITTTSLSGGNVSMTYSTTLAATGGTTPYSWSLSAGSLPAGLALKASTGVISGTPSATAAGTPLTFTVTDSGSPVQSKSVTLTMTIAGITIAISPARAGLTVTQALSLSAAINDNAGVTWSVSPAGGSFNPGTSLNGASVTFTAASTAGVYTLTATSVTDSTRSASITVGVTDLLGVYTYHNDLARDGVNSREFALTSANVNTNSFGKLFSCKVDAAVYAQPLWVANLNVGGARHNVVFVATSQDSLYAFDADTSPCLQLWHVSLIDTLHGGTAGEITNEDFGVIGTPVIDPTSNILYVVTRSLNSAATVGYQRLHAIDIATGNEKAGSPASIAATAPGTAVTFDPLQHLQRTGLALVNGNVYIAFGSNNELPTWYGWMLGYTYSAQNKAFSQVAVLNSTPVQINGENGGGIWMSGGAPAADESGNLYVITGNGSFNASTAGAPGPDYGDCFLQLSANLAVTSYFSPSDQSSLDVNDLDFGAGGATIVLTLSGGPLKHLVLGGGKGGVLYTLNGDSMGGAGDANAVQKINLNAQIFSNSAFWNNTLYIGPAGASLQAYAFDSSMGLFTTTWTTQSTTSYNWPGASPSISTAGSSGDAVVWAIDSSTNCGQRACGPAILHAYSAANLANELWNSSTVGADAAGNAVKFTVPTIANGKVYVGTRGNNASSGSSTIPGELDVYGLKPN